MNKVYTGKTKDVYALDNGNYQLKFKDDCTGTDGVFDPGANTVGLQIEGIGRENLKVSVYFFEILKKAGVKTHYVSADIDNATMEVLPAKVFGKGLEVICRYRAVGSFIRRYGAYMESGTPLNAYVETTLKDDDLGDPLINDYHALALGLATEDEIGEIKAMAFKVNEVMKDYFDHLNVTLVDFKLEFGKTSDGKIILADEISPDTCRLWDKTTGEKLDKDRFRRDLGGVEEAYQEIMRRVMGK